MYLISSRHAVTAGHCICSRTKHEPKTAAPCLSSDKNQIVSGKNEITVYGGRFKDIKTISPFFRSKWMAGSAYLMSNDDFVDDIGVVELLNIHIIFDEKALKNDWDLHHGWDLLHARIVPICLGASEFNIRHRDVRGLGWGKMYAESPDVVGQPRNPIYSSCMTNQASPDQWKFQNCDMKRMNAGIRWECDKTHPPPSYEDGQYDDCMKLFEKVKMLEDKKNPGKTIGERINKVDKIYEEYDNKKSLECINPDLLTNSGWCYLKDFPEKYEQPNWDPDREAWGICSPSCDPELMQV